MWCISQYFCLLFCTVCRILKYFDQCCIFFTYTARADGYFFKYALDIAFHWIQLHSTWFNKNFPLFMQKLKKKKRIGLILQRWWWWWCRVQWEVHWVADKADVINPTLQGSRMWRHFNSGGSVAMMVVMVEHMMRMVAMMILHRSICFSYKLHHYLSSHTWYLSPTPTTK